MKILKNRLTLFALFALLTVAALCPIGQTAAAAPSDESDVRATIQRVFDQLKSGQYGGLYDS